MPREEIEFLLDAAEEIITASNMSMTVHLPAGTQDAELTTSVHTTPLLRLTIAMRAVVAAGRECDRAMCASEDWHELMHALADLIAQDIEEGREDDCDDTGR